MSSTLVRLSSNPCYPTYISKMQASETMYTENHIRKSIFDLVNLIECTDVMTGINFNLVLAYPTFLLCPACSHSFGLWEERPWVLRHIYDHSPDSRVVQENRSKIQAQMTEKLFHHLDKTNYLGFLQYQMYNDSKAKNLP